MSLIRDLTTQALYDLLKYIGTPKSENPADVKLASRNLLISLLMCDAGLRISEALSLEVSDLWDFESGKPKKVLTVKTAKNGITREVPLTERIRQAVAWICYYTWKKELPAENFIQGKKPTVIPTAPAFGSHKSKTKICTRQIQRILAEAGKAIGEKVTPHMLRHTFATRLCKKNNNIRVIQILLGHQSINSTQIYTHPNADDCQNAIETL